MMSKRRSGTHTTCYVVAYDIPDDRRRTKVHQILMGFGKWTQYSLFECFSHAKGYASLAVKARYIPHPDEGQRAFLPTVRQLCRESRDSGRSLTCKVGDPPPTEEF